MLNRNHMLHLELEEVLYAYSFNRYNLGKYYLVADAKPLDLVINLPNTNKNKPQGNVLLFKAWGCTRDPILREFLVNTNPKASRVQRRSLFAFYGLIDLFLTLFAHV